MILNQNRDLGICLQEILDASSHEFDLSKTCVKDQKSQHKGHNLFKLTYNTTFTVIT